MIILSSELSLFHFWKIGRHKENAQTNPGSNNSEMREEQQEAAPLESCTTQ